MTPILYEYPPYMENAPVYEITLAEDTEFVRVFDSLEAIPPEGKSGIGGNWIMKQEDIIAKDVAEWGYGGGLQFDLMGQYIDGWSSTIKTIGSGPLQF